MRISHLEYLNSFGFQDSPGSTAMDIEKAVANNFYFVKTGSGECT